MCPHILTGNCLKPHSVLHILTLMCASQIDLSATFLKSEGAIALAPAIRDSRSLTQARQPFVALCQPCTLAPPTPCSSASTQIDLRSNQLCGLDFRGAGTYTAEGIKAIASAIAVSGSLTQARPIVSNFTHACAANFTHACAVLLHQITHNVEP